MNAAGLPASAVRGGIRTPLACLISLSTYLTVPTHKKHFLFSRIADPLGCLPRSVIRLSILMGHESIETTKKYEHFAHELIAVEKSRSHLDGIDFNGSIFTY